ncbi:MAG: DUF4202 domain-containing protein [Acidimicrobiales bacterium]
MGSSLAAVYDAIDTANADDPTHLSEGPRALVEGRRATHWISHLDSHAAEPVLIAARAHHLTRWRVPRQSYPEGRAGYLRWRRDQKKRHADDMADILAANGYGPADIERVQQLLVRTELGTDPEVQLVEDAACLVFLETQFDDIIERLEPDQLVTVVRKTLAKMSPAAVSAVSAITLSAEATAALAAAAPD